MDKSGKGLVWAADEEFSIGLDELMLLVRDLDGQVNSPLKIEIWILAEWSGLLMETWKFSAKTKQ